METEETTEEKKPRFIALRIFAGLFFFGAIKNGVDLILDEYMYEPLLWVRYTFLAVSMIGIFLLYRWAYFLFLAVVAFTIIAFQIVLADSPNGAQIGVGFIGPAIITALMVPKWKLLR